MSLFQKAVVGVGSLGALVAIGFLFSTDSSDARVEFCGFKTNNLNEINALPTVHSYVTAEFRLTNVSKHTIGFVGELGHPGHWEVRKASGQWTTNKPSFFCGLVVNDYFLEPSQSTNFSFIVWHSFVPEAAKIEKLQVSVEYWHQNRWRFFPQRLRSYSPWLKGRKEMASVDVPL